ncbi:serum paraoxonase/arylesterase 2-like isoform X2 [Pomacea canaliculata]|nr:serum paraoxonase/arylesterase 2-like isoform X2 [Pomacea canaliculata]
METLSDGLTFITSGLLLTTSAAGYKEHYRRNNLAGHVYLYDFKQPQQGVRQLKIVSTPHLDRGTFAPHGISVWEDKITGRHTVFVVNHPQREPPVDTIEKFTYDPEQQQLLHQATFSSPEMRLMNDVQATSDNSFYFTNSHASHSILRILLEVLLDLPCTNVVYFDGRFYSVVADGIRSANGIYMSHDRRYVYVAAITGQELWIFKRNNDSSLTEQQVYPLYSSPDNIIVDRVSGDLYLGSHPILFKLLQFMQHPGSSAAPSQVLHIRVKEGRVVSAQELLYDDGGQLAASSSAVVFNGRLLVGSVLHKLLHCDVTVPM